MTEHRMWPCPHCDLIIEGETTRCPHCGNDTTKALQSASARSGYTAGRCLVCHKAVSPHDQTCPHCGWELAAGAPTAELPGFAQETPKPKKSRWLTIGLPVLAVAVLSAIGVLIFNLADSGDEELYEGAWDIAGLTGEYSRYGVSFNIPSDLTALSETDITGTGQASTDSGFIMLSSSGQDFMVGVGWLASRALSTAPLSQTVNTEIAVFASLGGAEVESMGTVLEIPFLSDEVSARTFVLSAEGITAGGAMAAGLCTTRDRIVELVCASFSGLPGPFSDMSPTAQGDVCMDAIREIVATLDC